MLCACTSQPPKPLSSEPPAIRVPGKAPEQPPEIEFEVTLASVVNESYKPGEKVDLSVVVKPKPGTSRPNSLLLFVKSGIVNVDSRRFKPKDDSSLEYSSSIKTPGTPGEYTIEVELDVKWLYEDSRGQSELKMSTQVVKLASFRVEP